MIDDDDNYVDDDLDIDLDGEDYLEDDEILIPESEEESVDEDYIYEKLKRRNSPHATKIVGNSLTDEIVANESGGDYRAQNPYSSAVGKYQFLWGSQPGNGWGDKIKQVTGVRSKEEFRNSPEAQDMFYNEYYVPHEMMPAVKRLKQLAPELSDKKLAKLYHYQGEGGAGKYIRGEVPDVQQSYNAPISRYTGIKRQYGGVEGIKPIQTSFGALPTLDNNYSGALSNNQRNQRSHSTNDLEDSSNGIDFDDVAQVISDGYQGIKKISGGIADGLSTGIDLAEQFTSQQTNNQQYRKMMQKLSEDRASNYAPVSQRINNNPILT